MTGSAKQSSFGCKEWIASSQALLAMTATEECHHHFPAGAAGLAVSGKAASSPRVPVAIRKDAASRIAIVSAAEKIAKGLGK
jgi:hypothetical protein